MRSPKRVQEVVQIVVVLTMLVWRTHIHLFLLMKFDCVCGICQSERIVDWNYGGNMVKRLTNIKDKHIVLLKFV